MPERQGGGGAGGWREGEEPVSLADAAIGAELALEAATPFGFKRPARELLARFGGEGPEGRRRAIAALELAGVVAEPSLADAQPHQFVQLRRVAPVADEAETAPAATGPRERVAALLRSANSLRRPRADGDAAPVATDRRVKAGALGFGALVVLMVAAVLLRGVAGDRGQTADALPAGTAPATTSTASTTTPRATNPATTSTATTTAPVRRPRPARTTRSAPPPPTTTTQAAPPPASSSRDVLLRVVPSEPAYVCVADGGGRTLLNEVIDEPYTVRRDKLILRVGVATARIHANGRPIRVGTAPGAFELTPGATRELPGEALTCGG